MDRFQVPATARASFAFYNTKEEVDALGERNPRRDGGFQLMSDLRDLYQDLILDHTKRPRNFGQMENANCRADGHNPLCGDKLTVFLDVENGVVKDVRFQGSGCAISTASASMMTESIKGKTRAEVETLFEKFHHMLTGPQSVELEDETN